MPIEDLSRRISTCQLCDLAAGRTQAVIGEGPFNANLMLVGEAPGADEDFAGRPFVGRCGKLLDKCLAQAGIDRSKIYITNVVKCRPPGNRKPKRSEINACLPHLHHQINLINPEIVCLMGNVATYALVKEQGVTLLHGRILKGKYFITFHPAAPLRNRNLLEVFISDLQRIKELCSGDK